MRLQSAEEISRLFKRIRGEILKFVFGALIGFLVMQIVMSLVK